MTQHPWLDAAPFFLPGGKAGALLVHGFTGAPTEVRPLGERLAARGYTVSGPLLPGHGTSADDLSGRRWTEWLAAAEAAYLELAGSCQQLFIAGLSLGALLAIRLAAAPPGYRPPDGLALFSPAIFVANPMIRFSWLANILPISIPQKPEDSDLVDPEADGRIWCYNSIPGRAAHQVRQFNLRVRRLLPSVTAPTLVVMSTRDRTLDFASGPHVIQTIRSTDKELVTLHRSGHNILADAEREAVLDHTVRFFDRLCRP